MNDTYIDIKEDGSLYVMVKLGPFRPDEAELVLDIAKDAAVHLNQQLQMIMRLRSYNREE